VWVSFPPPFREAVLSIYLLIIIFSADDPQAFQCFAKEARFSPRPLANLETSPAADARPRLVPAPRSGVLLFRGGTLRSLEACLKAYGREIEPNLETSQLPTSVRACCLLLAEACCLLEKVLCSLIRFKPSFSAREQAFEPAGLDGSNWLLRPEICPRFGLRCLRLPLRERQRMGPAGGRAGDEDACSRHHPAHLAPDVAAAAAPSGRRGSSCPSI